MEPISLAVAILGAGVQLGRVIENVRHVMSSMEEATELKRQLKALDDIIDDVENDMRRLGGLVPPRLSDIIHDLGQYCTQLAEYILDFHRRFRKKRAFRIWHWIAMGGGWNQIEKYQAQLEDCENWYNIAVKTLHLTVSQEVRSRSPSSLPSQLTEEDILRGRRENRSKIQLRQALNRVRRAPRDRYNRMRRAGIDLSRLREFAEDILDRPATTGTNSGASTPVPRPNAQRDNPYSRYYQEPEQSFQPQIPRQVPQTVPVVVQDFQYHHQLPVIRRPENFPIYERAIPERQPIQQYSNTIEYQPQRSYHPDGPRETRRNSTRSRSSSISQDSGFVDELPRYRIPDVNDRSRPPISYNNHQERLGRHRKRSRSRSSSESHDSGFFGGSSRASSSSVRESSQSDRENGNSRSTRSSERFTTSRSYSGYRDESPRYSRQQPIENSRQLPEEYLRERRHRRSERRGKGSFQS